ncbi:MAG: hypothetical protein RL205_168 [Actinomycetota bacterium]
MALVAVSPLLGGCFQGQQATTTMQASMNSGDGVQVQLGNLKAQGLTLVLGAEPGTASLVGRFINVGPETEFLREVTIGGKTMANGDVAVTSGLGQILPGQSLGFGYDSDQAISVKNLDTVVSTYVPISIAFEVNGTVETKVLTVPAAGIYAGITPSFPPAPVASPVASDVASASPSPAAS